MLAFIKSFARRTRVASLLARLSLASLFCLNSMPHAHAAATLLLEEPYSYDGAFAGTGHVAVYLSNVCSVSPVELRRCKAGETGVVLSRYDGINGYDWIAIPLIPYLYAVDREEAIPLFADANLVAFLRDQYRRDHLETLAPDRPDGSTPVGNWYEMVGSSYDRTIYAFKIETTPDQDARLISHLNSEPNRERYNFVKRNCADFVREVVNFYYPHALHRSIVGDLGVTTPKQIAKMLVKYSHHHPELDTADFLVPQMPGSVRRSKPVHGVLESVLAAKKYMVPLVVLHPYIGGGLLIEYFGHRRFDPARNDLVMDARLQLDAPITRDQRITYQSRVDEMAADAPVLDSVSTGTTREAKEKGKDKEGNREMKAWERLQASGVPSLDASGRPVLKFDSGDESEVVGLTRSNILSGSSNPELASDLMEARLRQELRPATARKTALGDVEKDLSLFRQLRVPARDHARDDVAASSANGSPIPVGAPLQ